LTGRDLRDVATHFRFGENWADYAMRIDEVAVARACGALKRLCGRSDLSGLTFLDIGSGSGLQSVAALKMGAGQVVAMDIDADSVTTTENTLRRFAPPGSSYKVMQCSVFEMAGKDSNLYDIVYSWGVLHHTGSMIEAIRLSAEKVRPGGQICLALYAKTKLCRFWKWEKRLYSSASPTFQAWARQTYVVCKWAISFAAHARRGQWFNLNAHIENYDRERGMNFWNDVHDWLGGYPYESIEPDDAKALMERLGFIEERRFLVPGRRLGLTGSGCDEYSFVRRAINS
jgi:SAM-dependent methyltransferase